MLITTTNSIDNARVEKYFTMALADKSKKAQLQLLRKALSVLKKGESMVYSTCSILKDENEDIVSTVLRDGGVEIVPIDTSKFVGMDILPSTIDGVLTVCPSLYYEGFFVAKLKKIK